MGKRSILILIVIITICFMLADYIILQRSFITEEEIKNYKENVRLILNGKSYDEDTYSIEQKSKGNKIISLKYDKVQTVNFYVNNGEIVDCTVIIDRLALVLNFVFLLLLLIYASISIVLLMVCLLTLKLNITRKYQKKFSTY